MFESLTVKRQLTKSFLVFFRLFVWKRKLYSKNHLMLIRPIKQLLKRKQITMALIAKWNNKIGKLLKEKFPDREKRSVNWVENYSLTFHQHFHFQKKRRFCYHFLGFLQYHNFIDSPVFYYYKFKINEMLNYIRLCTKFNYIYM